MSNNNEYKKKEMKKEEESLKPSKLSWKKRDFVLRKLIVFLKRKESSMNLKNKDLKKNFRSSHENQSLCSLKMMNIFNKIKFHSMLIAHQLKGD